MAEDPIVKERILERLRPYAANWSGSLGRGDLVIPERELPGLVAEILEIIDETRCVDVDVSSYDLFLALREIRTQSSIQDQATELLRRYRIAIRSDPTSNG